MNKQIPPNVSEILFFEESYKGLHVYTGKGPLVVRYLEDAFGAVECALSDWPRVFALRFDVQLPKECPEWPDNVMTVFLASLEAQIRDYLLRHKIPPASCKPRFLWAKEQDREMNLHYHLMILLDGDIFCSGSVIWRDDWSLRDSVEKALASALRLPLSETEGLVRFLENDEYTVDRHEDDFLIQLSRLFYRLSYLTRAVSKPYGSVGEFEKCKRCFSCSSRTSLQSGFSLEELIKSFKWEVFQLDADETIYSPESPEDVGKNAKVVLDMISSGRRW